MAQRLQVKPHRNFYDIDILSERNQGSSYHNIIDRDPKKIAIVLMDLYREGFPIEEAVRIFLNKVEQRDWLSL